MHGSLTERIPLGPEQEIPTRQARQATPTPGILPAGYARYLRLFHPFLPADPSAPDKSLPGAARTWRSLADEVGVVFHPEIQAWSLIDALGGVDEESRPFWMKEGRLEEPVRGALFKLLDRGDSPGAYFLFQLGAAVRGTDALLYRAPVSAYREVQVAANKALREKDESAPCPEFVWPLDQSWVVNTDDDLESTYVACGDDLAEAILAATDIEAVAVSRTIRVGGADLINSPRADAPGSPASSGDRSRTLSH